MSLKTESEEVNRELIIMAQNVVLETYRAPGSNLAPNIVQVKILGVHEGKRKAK